MNSIKRNGVDIEAAFSLASRRLHARKPALEPVAVATADAATEASDDVQHPSQRTLRHHVKRALRSLARNVFHVTRPFTRPLLFRVRNYFTSSLRHEMLQEFGKLQELQREQTEQILRELQKLKNAASVQTSFSRKLIAEQLHPEKAHSHPSQEAEELPPGVRKLMERLLQPVDALTDAGTGKPLPENRNLKLLRIDAQGSETEILKDAQQLIASDPRMSVIVAFAPARLKEHSHFGPDLELRVINDRTGELEEWPTGQSASAESIHLLFSSRASTQARGKDS